MRRYNVVEVKQKGFFAGRFTADKFTALLNEQAREGWIFDKVVAAETRWMDRDTFMIVLYRDE